MNKNFKIVLLMLLLCCIFLVTGCDKKDKDAIINSFKEAKFAPDLDKLFPKSIQKNTVQKTNYNGATATTKLAIGTEIDSSNLVYEKATPYMKDDIERVSISAEERKSTAIKYISSINLTNNWQNVAIGSSETGKARYLEENDTRILHLDVSKKRAIYGGGEEIITTKSIIKLYADGAVEVISDGLYDGITYLKNTDGEEFEIVFEFDELLRYGIFNKAANGDYVGTYVSGTANKSLAINYAYGNDSEYNDIFWQYNYPYVENGDTIGGLSIYTVVTQKNDKKTTLIRQWEDPTHARNYYEVALNSVTGIKKIDYNPSSATQLYINPDLNKLILDTNEEVSQLSGGLELKLRNIYHANTDKSGFILDGVTAVIAGSFMHFDSGDLSTAFQMDISEKFLSNNLHIASVDFSIMNLIEERMQNITVKGIKNIKDNYLAFETEIKKLTNELNF